MAMKRFEKVHSEGVMSGMTIMRDNATGVLYLVATEGFGGGITVMVDRDGKPLVDEQYIAWLDTQPPQSL